MSWFEVDARATGPIFDGRAVRVMEEYLNAIKNGVGEQGVRVVRTELNRVLRNQTGYYRSNIAHVREGGDVRIHDSRVVYGPWLEGKGSRNFPVTRFRGYKTFERMTPLIQRFAGIRANRLLRQRFLRRLN